MQEKEQAYDPQYPHPRAVDAGVLPGAATRNGAAKAGGEAASRALQIIIVGLAVGSISF